MTALGFRVGPAQAALDPCLDVLRGAPRAAAVAALDGWSAEALGWLLEEVAYRNDWFTHQDALAAGFAVGDEVYGEPLSLDGVFDPAAVARWREQYAQQRRVQFIRRSGGSLDALTVGADVVAALSGGCLRPGLWAALRPAAGCRFVFRAGFRGNSRSAAATTPRRLEVQGARCLAWPAQALDASGAQVPCVRSGDKPVSVRLVTRDGASAARRLAARGQITVPPEPVRETRRSAPHFENVTLYRTRDYRVVARSARCQGCDVYAADFAPGVAGATILDVGTVSGSVREGWQRCPAAMLCPAPEFSPPGERSQTGCAGLDRCRVWRLARDSLEASDTIQITYQVVEEVCRNCPPGVGYEDAKRRYEQAKAAAALACPTFADPAPQTIRVPRKR